ncbi:MAG: PSD1 and planctomycete cytochrome C domain-containing protein [Planctomycetaceae bacterium]|nr:PSD1 and planctomycete cytochrome C domain-containing protein [Planctomycetaceae bacterium]
MPIVTGIAPVLKSLAAVGCLMIPESVSAQPPVDFNRDIRPILSDACFHCHGPDPGTREADLRLDTEEGAKDWAVVPGRVDESEVISRILADDPDIVMPPPDSGKQLTGEQKRLLQQWIRQGAPWAAHWAFVPPVRARSAGATAEHPVDVLIKRRLEGEGLTLSPAAAAHVLARRVSFDLTGLPPADAQLQAFVAQPDDQAFARLVDELLASPRFGERMATEWLDAARYADSDGYQQDATRQNWPWRDWVIDAFNGNMPFDQFTLEQFAGDLLPDATPEQILATCFHRNHMHNGEGGRDAEESRVEYVIDRVNTMGTVWLGLTLGCAQCHTHKYDPISHAEYYQLNAFFNSIDEDGRAGGNAKPFLKYTSPYVTSGQQDARQWLAIQKSRLASVRTAQLEGFERWLGDVVADRLRPSQVAYQSWITPVILAAQTTSSTRLQVEGDNVVVRGVDPRHDDYLLTLQPQARTLTGLRLTVLPTGAQPQLSRSSDGHFLLTNLKVRRRSADGATETDLEIRRAVADHQAKASGRVYGPVATVLDDDPRTGWSSDGRSSTETRTACFEFAQPIVLSARETVVVELRQRSLRGYSNLQRFRLELTDEASPGPLSLQLTPLEKTARRIADTPQSWRKELPPALLAELQKEYLAQQPEFRRAEAAVAQADRRARSYDAAAKPRSVTVLKQTDKQRPTHVLTRGVWDAKGKLVSAATPEILNTPGETPSDRLQLARWLVHRRHPLTARVIVNRYWQMLFGSGLVRTPGDFGTQGAPPTHPELLDWLAVEFMESGWDVKHMLRLMVTSQTYRQQSHVTAELQRRDPDNRLLARQTRFRLPSWMIRDAALAAGGLLDGRIGGPPVYPFQPEGAWMDATMGRFRYEPSVGADRYRRSLYTFWRRSVAPTGMFDASPRRVCEVRAVRTNTPLHALTLLNDETFLEAARGLAERAQSATTDGTSEPVVWIFKRVLQRAPSAQEAEILRRQLQQHLADFQQRPEAARRLLQVGQPTETESERVPTAALMMVASTLLNLDEAMTRE